MFRKILIATAYNVGSLLLGVIMSAISGLSYVAIAEHYWPLDPNEAAGPEAARGFFVILIVLGTFLPATLVALSTLERLFPRNPASPGGSVAADARPDDLRSVSETRDH